MKLLTEFVRHIKWLQRLFQWLRYAIDRDSAILFDCAHETCLDDEMIRVQIHQNTLHRIHAIQC